MQFIFETEPEITRTMLVIINIFLSYHFFRVKHIIIIINFLSFLLLFFLLNMLTIEINTQRLLLLTILTFSSIVIAIFIIPSCWNVIWWKW